LQNASYYNKRTHQNAALQNGGAAVLAPHGAFGCDLHARHAEILHLQVSICTISSKPSNDESCETSKDRLWGLFEVALDHASRL
jgi:hypothetical protein